MTNDPPSGQDGDIDRLIAEVEKNGDPYGQAMGELLRSLQSALTTLSRKQDELPRVSGSVP